MELQGTAINIINFLGAPVIAVGIGLLIAIYGLTSKMSKDETLEKMEQGIKSAGIIILVTGGGGALGTVLRDSGAGDYIARLIAALAACVGSLVFSYFNDSYYWVVNRMLGIRNAKEQMRVWSVTTTIAWAVGLVTLLILNAFFG